ncbi:MAG: Gfo/Idh/MocA family oxidoreductase [Proteobacteria bacterium]|nr:Gfo/Idh/MocA family oxidoreductase [Pseudomonadota bacterium]
MSKKIHVAIVGLGRVGGTFLKKLLASESKGIVIVAVAESNSDSPGIKLAKDNGIAAYEDVENLVEMGDKIDIIFELTGNMEARKSLRAAMVRTSNSHTVIAPEIMAFLIWDLVADGGELAVPERKQGY